MNNAYTLVTAIGNPDSKTFRVMQKPFGTVAGAFAEWDDIKEMLKKHPVECHSLLFKTVEFERLMRETERKTARDTWNTLVSVKALAIPLES